MLEQKHNKRAAISQVSSDSNPTSLNSVTSTPSKTTSVNKPTNIKGVAIKTAGIQPFRAGIKDDLPS